MLFGDITLVNMMKQKMHWHEARQKVLSNNVANAETPGFRARDIAAPQFDVPQSGAGYIKPVTLAATTAGHIDPVKNGNTFSTKPYTSFETTPEGNAVVLEDEVMRVSQNVMDYQAVTQLYTKGLGFIKTALGRSA